MKSITTLGMFALALIFPITSFAGSGEFTELNTFAGAIVGFINNTLIPLIFAVALLVFIWGMFTYFILGGGDETKRESGKSLMLWSIIAFVMMIIIFGLVNLLANGLLSGIGQDNTTIDQFPSAAVPGGVAE